MRKIWLTLLLISVLVFSLNSAYAAETICVYEFYSPSCPVCAHVSDKLDGLSSKYPTLEVHKINVRKEPGLFLEVQDLYGISTADLSKIPKVFIGEHYWIGIGENGRYLKEYEPVIQSYLDTGVHCLDYEGPEPVPEPKNETEPVAPPVEPEEPPEEPEEKEHITFLGITGLALVDAVNPCALAVLVLLLTAILLKYPERKRMALASGISFTISIYIIYFLLGMLIIFGFKAASSVISSIWMYRALGLFAMVIGILNTKDFFKVGGGGFEMAVPMSWRPKMKQIIRSVTSPKGAFFMGIIVSLFLLPCTSGPYFVAGGLLANVSWFKAMLWLIYYNFLFVLPMIVITLFVYFGLAQADKIQGWRERNIGKLHLFAGLILIILGFIILMG